MDVFLSLTTSSDHSVSLSSRIIDTSTVTPSFVTVRESPDSTILGSRSIIVASAFRGSSIRGSRRILGSCPAAKFRAYVGGPQNAPAEADPGDNRSSADDARGKRRDH